MFSFSAQGTKRRDPAILRGRSGAMSKRSLSLGHCSVRPAKRPSQRQRQHLYVLLDDWERGCSIYRFSEDDFYTDSDPYLESPHAEYPLARIEARHPLSWSFAAHGSKILGVRGRKGSPAVSGFDTKTKAVTLCPFPQCGSFTSKPFYISVGDRLFVMIYPLFEMLSPQPPPDSTEPWSWSGIKTDLPFLPQYVTGYAMHPDGCTVFVSVMGWKPGDNKQTHDCLQQSTYSFDTKCLTFQYHGEWLLPYRGQAHYNKELDAWIGLSDEVPGCVCSLDIPSRAKCETKPYSKLSKDKLFDHESRRHLGATLVYMGGSRYCLVQCRVHKDGEGLPYLRHRVILMNTFGLKYGKKGELQISGHRGCASMAYKVPHETVGPTLDPTAFWI